MVPIGYMKLINQHVDESSARRRVAWVFLRSILQASIVPNVLAPDS